MSQKLTRNPRRWLGFLAWWLIARFHRVVDPCAWLGSRFRTFYIRHIWPLTTRLFLPIYRLRGPFASRLEWTDPSFGRLYGGDGGRRHRDHARLLAEIGPPDPLTAAQLEAYEERFAETFEEGDTDA